MQDQVTRAVQDAEIVLTLARAAKCYLMADIIHVRPLERETVKEQMLITYYGEQSARVRQERPKYAMVHGAFLPQLLWPGNHTRATSRCAAEDSGWGWKPRGKPVQHPLVEKFIKDMAMAEALEKEKKDLEQRTHHLNTLTAALRDSGDGEQELDEVVQATQQLRMYLKTLEKPAKPQGATPKNPLMVQDLNYRLNALPVVASVHGAQPAVVCR